MNSQKGSVLGILLLIAVIVIVVMGCIFYKMYNDKQEQDKTVDSLTAQVTTLTSKNAELQNKIDKISDTIKGVESSTNNTNTLNTTDTSVVSNKVESKDVKYSFSDITDETKVTLTATKDSKNVTKDITATAAIHKTETMTLPDIGEVALVSDTGGEYYGVTFYQLVDGAIKEIGKIGLGDVVLDATYSMSNKTGNLYEIVANRNGEETKKEVNYSSLNIDEQTKVINVLGYKIFAINDNGNLDLYGLTQDYITGNTTGIDKLGTINY